MSPLVGLLQAGDHAQQRGLAAAGRADEDDELAVVDLQVDAVDHARGAEVLADLPAAAVMAMSLHSAEAMPAVMYFCRKANTSVIGSSVITVIASR